MKYLRRILGIDEILRNINAIENKLKIQPREKLEIQNSVEFVNPNGNKPFLYIESLINGENQYDESKNIRPIGNSAKIMSFIQYLPFAQTVKQSEMLKGAYKVVFPEGAIGQLMRYKNGMLGTPLVQSGKGIGNTHAGLVALQNMSLTPVMVFTALSAITGQYFMARIDKSLESISKDVKEIISMFLDDKETKNKAILYFYSYIKDNFDLVVNNPDLRVATLTNLQSFLVELKHNQLFYEKMIGRNNAELVNVIDDFKTTNKRIEELSKVQGETSQLLIQQHICLELLLIGKIYEMQLAQIFDGEYCSKLIYELNNYIVSGVEFSRNIINKHSEVLTKVESKAFLNKNKVHNQKEETEINFTKRLVEFEDNTRATINSIQDIIELNNRKQVFIVRENQLYYLNSEVS